MTNSMIILLESVKLMQAGILNGTGQMIQIKNGDEITETELPEPIHTFQHWKELGYSVKKGEHAVAKFLIWKHTSKVKEMEMQNVDTGATESVPYNDKRMFMKMSSFFRECQVEPIKH